MRNDVREKGNDVEQRSTGRLFSEEMAFFQRKAREQEAEEEEEGRTDTKVMIVLCVDAAQ